MKSKPKTHIMESKNRLKNISYVNELLEASIFPAMIIFFLIIILTIVIKKIVIPAFNFITTEVFNTDFVTPDLNLESLTFWGTVIASSYIISLWLMDITYGKERCNPYSQ